MTDDDAEAQMSELERRYRGVLPSSSQKSELSDVEREMEALKQNMDRDYPGLREGKPVKQPPDNVLPFKAPDSVNTEDPK